MGIEYDLISDEDHVGYELGKGPWGDEEFVVSLRSAEPFAAVVAFLVNAGGGLGWGVFTSDYAERIAREIISFTATYTDWRVINDASSDITVADEETWRLLVIEEGSDPDDKDFPIYRQVGSRFKPVYGD